MKKLLLSMFAVLILTACATLEEYDNSVRGNFDVLWTTLDEHYCYFPEKGIDWQGVRTIYLPRAEQCKTDEEFFNVCSAMLDTLRDGHVNLISTANVSYYRKWWTDYPQDFNLRTLQQYYLNFDYKVSGSLYYKKMNEGRTGYIYCGSFSSAIGEGQLDAIFSYFNECETLIFDIRNNGGGMVTNVETIIARFINSDYTAAYIRHKTGPGHEDFSEPYAMTYHPAAGRIHWDKPIYLLTNRACFSAANDFASAMRQLPQVTTVGARTGGGGGMPFTAQMPCGWRIRFSACPVSNAAGEEIESGLDPDIEVHSPDDELAAGQDRILDVALSLAAL